MSEAAAAAATEEAALHTVSGLHPFVVVVVVVC